MNGIQEEAWDWTGNLANVGFLQVALLLGAAFLFGLKKDEPVPARPSVPLG